MDVQKLLDAAKEAQSIATDKGLAEALGVTKQAVSNWRKGVSLPDTVTCATLAGLTGIPLARVLGVIGEARAISREEKAVWRKLAATAALLAVGVLGSFPGLSQAAQGQEKAGPDIHYAKYRMGALGWLGRLFWTWLAHKLPRKKPDPGNIEASVCA